jgi:hypothetical protein
MKSIVMREILGHQAFLARDYANVVKEFEPFLKKGKASDSMKKKLVIAFIQVGRIEDALKLFIHLGEKDLGIIAKTDPIYDECPCPELVYDLVKKEDYQDGSADYYTSLAILWAYCDMNHTLNYLDKAIQKSEDPALLKIAYTQVFSYMKKQA